MTKLILLSASFLTLTSWGADKSWSAKMQELSKVMTELVPDVSIGNEDDAAKKRIGANLKKLEGLAKDIQGKHGKLAAPDADPSLQLFSTLFQQQAHRAYASFKAGRVSYAKGLTRNIAGYCIACHSRNQTGPNLPTFDFDKKIEKLPTFEKAQFYASTRRFDAALPEYIKIVSDGEVAKTRQLEWQKSVHQALAIAVRYKKDPSKATEIVDKILSSDAPEFLKKYTQSWKESIAAWKKEETKENATEDAMSELMHKNFKAGAEKQKYSLDHSGDIFFLRASATAHDLLAKYPNGEKAGDALLTMGRSYEILNDPVLWPVHELYYETCIRKYPHSSTAKDCYRYLEESVYFGYSGSAGFAIPADAQQLLKELKGISSSPPDRKGQ